jgi:hypothetical protein
MSITREEALKIMEKRGYESISHSQSGDEIVSINFIKPLNDQITIHAKVELKSASITLSFRELKYFCELRCHSIAYDHKDFEKYEQIMMIYVAKCLDIDVFSTLTAWRFINGDGFEEKPEAKQPKKNVKERKRELWDKIVVYGKQKNYSQKMCLAFYNYWTEMNEGGKKMRFEMQKVFNVEGRLRTWASKDEEYNMRTKNFVEQKVEKQNKETETSKTLKKSELF